MEHYPATHKVKGGCSHRYTYLSTKDGINEVYIFITYTIVNYTLSQYRKQYLQHTSDGHAKGNLQELSPISFYIFQNILE